MRQIYCINIVERIPDQWSYNIHGCCKIIQSYPFPDVPLEHPADNGTLIRRGIGSIVGLKQLIELIEDDQQRLATRNRLDFIMNVWHPKNFFEISLTDWKYP